MRDVWRREALALLGGVGAMACARSPERREASAPVPTLKLDALVDLIPAAGLVWLVEVRPREIIESRILRPAVATIIPDWRFDAFAQHHGGIDLRAAEQLVIGAYPQATLALARVPFDPGRVATAFGKRVATEEGRAVERGGVTRIWGSVSGGREQIALLAPDALAFERGQTGPLQTAVYFAQGRLRRSLPVLRAEPLAQAASLAGNAPLRVFAPGPFGEAWASGIAGLLRATTAVAVSLRVARTPERSEGTGANANVPRTPERSEGAGENGSIALRLLLLGGWGEDAPAAAERLRAAYDVLTEDALGRLTGLNRPVDGPTVSAGAGALMLQVTLDPGVLARGIHVATAASLDEIMAY